jgi:4-hydroxy-2-oxoheptanedioate aldolase
MMQTNALKAKLNQGENVFGCFMRYSDASLVEVLRQQGRDFLVIDGEHGTLEPRDVENMVRAAELYHVTPIVRVPTNQQPIILRYMDTGAHGIHVPMVNSSSDAESVVKSVKYPPVGLRGLAGVRASDYGQRMSLAEFVHHSNKETLIVIHIETMGAIENLPEIIKVEEIDVVFIGPMDLSSSLGQPGQFEHPVVKSAFERIAGLVNASHVKLGVMVNNVQSAHNWVKIGADYITIGLESLLCPVMQDYLAEVRKLPHSSLPG